MKLPRLHTLFLLVLIGAALTVPSAAAQNLLPGSTCGLEQQYWIVEGGGWHSIWEPMGGNAFFGRGAFWQQDDVSSNLNITINGNSVVVDRVDNPNVWGTLTCTHTGTIRPDGVSIVGTAVCQLTSGVSTALSWTAQIVCNAPLVTWSDTAFWHRAAKGSQFNFYCPANGFAAPIWGTGVYIEGSSICTAGVHAGAITLVEGGLVTIEILPGEMAYPGSSANGITSETFPTPGQFNASFRVVNGVQPAPTTSPIPTATVEGAVTYPDMYGKWGSSFGDMEFTPGVATYGDALNNNEAFIYFEQIDAYNIEGYWVQPMGSGVTCQTELEGVKWWGRFRATFEPGYARFNGQWTYCDAEYTPEGYWAGYR
ncbi:MAG: hypothetical protein JNL42_05650 [Anaerolineae bacterium]|nr:hypothetical protein [Anaerolineae bacterium]